MTNLVQHKQIQIKQQSYIENPCNKFFQYFFFSFSSESTWTVWQIYINKVNIFLQQRVVYPLQILKVIQKDILLSAWFYVSTTKLVCTYQ